MAPKLNDTDFQDVVDVEEEPYGYFDAFDLFAAEEYQICDRLEEYYKVSSISDKNYIKRTYPCDIFQDLYSRDILDISFLNEIICYMTPEQMSFSLAYLLRSGFNMFLPLKTLYLTRINKPLDTDIQLIDDGEQTRVYPTVPSKIIQYMWCMGTEKEQYLKNNLVELAEEAYFTNNDFVFRQTVPFLKENHAQLESVIYNIRCKHSQCDFLENLYKQIYGLESYGPFLLRNLDEIIL